MITPSVARRVSRPVQRLEHIGDHLKANGTIDPNFKLIPKLHYDFGLIQRRAKALLEGQGNKVEWPARSIKHLRSTYASQLSEHLSSFQLKELLGHSSVTTTERHYVAAAGDLGQKVRDAFDGKASKAATA